MDTYFQGTWRMDWGLGNPNKTAALIALLMVLVWTIALFKKWGFWVALSICTGLGFGLIHTFSRGGLLAALVGLAVVLKCAKRPFPRSRIFAVLGLISVLAAYGFYIKAANRYLGGVLEDDLSIANRLEIWKAAPAMMVDAPGGWGLGKSGEAYMQWYQPLHRREEYRTLVNSHLTWLVEFGWALRLTYLVAWSFILWSCWPSGRHRFILSICLGSWLTLAVACFFSSVGESPLVWIVPGVTLVLALGLRWKSKEWPGLRSALALAFVDALLLGALYALGEAGNDRQISFRHERITLGSGGAMLWLVPHKDVLGKKFGRFLRTEFSMERGQFTVVVSDQMPSSDDSERGGILTVAGLGNDQAQDPNFKRWSTGTRCRLLLINPRCLPSIAFKGNESGSNCSVWLGTFSQSPANSWKEWDAANIKFFDGIGDYSPRWVEEISSYVHLPLDLEIK